MSAAKTRQVILRLTEDDWADLMQIAAHYSGRVPGQMGVPTCRAAIAAIKSHASELRRRKRREPDPEDSP